MSLPAYYFSHVIGHFVFDDQFKIVDSGEEYKLKKKYPNLIEITEQNITAYKQILLALKTSHYVPLFYEHNRAATKSLLKTVANKDNFITQTIACMDDTLRARDILMHRVGEWCSLFNPEVSKTKDLLSMDLTADAKDAAPIKNITNKINDLSELWNSQHNYLKEVMDKYCPNLAAVAGYELGGRLIILAGTLENMSKMTSSQIQVLGAEKAFFKHLMHNTQIPKHGILVLHPVVKKTEDKAKATRKVADKISIAVRVDYFKGKFIGNKLRKEVEEQ